MCSFLSSASGGDHEENTQDWRRRQGTCSLSCLVQTPFILLTLAEILLQKETKSSTTAQVNEKQEENGKGEHNLLFAS